MAASAHRRPRFAIRSADLERRLDTFLVVAIASVLGNRLFLILTGYPQIGNGTLHISHAIWGALMMAIAVILALSFLAPSVRPIVAFLGGMGFGWFIDELGKFITRDVNYFFKPTIALIYMVFVVMYLVFRSLGRRPLDAREATVNALDALKRAATGELDEPRRDAALELLDETNADDAISRQVRALLEDAPSLPAPDPGRFARLGRAARARYVDLSARPGYGTVVQVVVVLFAIVKFVTAIVLALDGRGITTFNEKAAVASSLVAGLLMMTGVALLRRHRLEAYRWLDRGLLVDIFVTQVFVFAQEQLAGVFGLAVTLVVWALLSVAIRAEREEQVLARARSHGSALAAAP